MFHFVYHTVIKNTKTGEVKHYIGKHSTENLDDGYVGSGIYIRNCKAKNLKQKIYDFQTVIVKFVDTAEELNSVEVQLIEECKLQFGNKCKNISIGGDGYNWKGRKHTPETKLKISKSWKGKKRSESTKKKMSEAHKGEKSHMYGVRKSEEVKKKISKALSGRKGIQASGFKGWYSTPYGLLDRSADGEKFGIPASTLRRWCHNKKEGYSFIPC